MALAHYALQPWFSWLERALKRLWTDQEFPNGKSIGSIAQYSLAKPFRDGGVVGLVGDL
jgi:hypothetical protein